MNKIFKIGSISILVIAIFIFYAISNNKNCGTENKSLNNEERDTFASNTTEADFYVDYPDNYYTSSNNIATSGNLASYSDNNECSHGNCTNKRLSGSRYCSSHTCSESGCYKEVNSKNAKCDKHKQEYYNKLGIGDVASVANCAVPGCNTDAYKDSKYCISNVCRQKGCNNGQYGGNKYCYDHCPH